MPRAGANGGFGMRRRRWSVTLGLLLAAVLAQPATAASVQQAQVRMAQLEKAKADAIERAKENAATLSRTVLTIAQQAGDDGRLFGSVTSQDIADAIKEARGITVDKRKVHLPDPIKSVGTYQVVV